MSDAEKSVIQKIKKLLALSRSSNEHEAALALQKAQELMSAHAITSAAILMAEVGESKAGASVNSAPSRWEMSLSNLVSEAFGCERFFNQKWRQKGHWSFIGITPAPEIAAYAFQTLFRQVSKQRRDYIKGLKRIKPETKTRRGNLFAEGWVSAVRDKVASFAGQDQTGAVKTYLAKHYPDLRSFDAKDKDRKIHIHDNNAIHAGRAAGKHAQLNHGVGGGGETLALTGGAL